MHYDNLVITVLADAQTQVNAIKGGQVNGLNVIDQSTLTQIEGAGFTAYPHELDWTGLMLMDRAGTVNPALAKLEVRQAINHAIDRDAMLKAVAQGNGTVTGQVFPETSPGYDAALDDKYPFDPDEGQGRCWPTPATPTASTSSFRCCRPAPPPATTWSSSTSVTLAST